MCIAPGTLGAALVPPCGSCALHAPLQRVLRCSHVCWPAVLQACAEDGPAGVGHAQQPHRRRVLRPGCCGLPVFRDREQYERSIPPQPRQPRLAGAEADAAAAEVVLLQARSGAAESGVVGPQFLNSCALCQRVAQTPYGCSGATATLNPLCCAVQNGNDEEGKRHGGNALPRMRRLQRSGSISFTQRQVQSCKLWPAVSSCPAAACRAYKPLTPSARGPCSPMQTPLRRVQGSSCRRGVR